MDRRTFLTFLGSYLISQQIGLPKTIWAFAPPDVPVQPHLRPTAKLSESRDHQNLQAIPDIWLSTDDQRTLQTVLARFVRIQATVGHGNFNLIGFDESLRVARDYRRVGDFTGRELAFLDKLFHTDANVYGFKGRKVFDNMTDTIGSHKIRKIPGSGNYLFRGPSYATFKRLSQDIGDQLILTAGIRGIAKQFYLFLKKIAQNRGNLSISSRSLAPPGYSYHGVGDFDVGQAGYGAANFTDRFSRTQVYRNIKQLDYVVFRYPRNNQLGVRFEPWHILVSPDMA